MNNNLNQYIVKKKMNDIEDKIKNRIQKEKTIEQKKEEE